MTYYNNLDKEKELNKGGFDDIPLWLSNIGKSLGEWFNPTQEMITERERQNALYLEEQERQKRIFGENIQNALRPPDWSQAQPQLNKLGSDISQWAQNVNQMNVGKSMLEVANPMTAIPQAMQIASPLFEGIQKGSESVLSQTPLAGKDIRPYTTPIESWNPESENPLLRAAGITPKGLMGVLGDPTNLLGVGAPMKAGKGFNLLDDAVRLLQKGMSKESIIKALTESPVTKAQNGRLLPLKEAEDLLKTAELKISELVKGTEALPKTEAVRNIITDVELDSVGNVITNKFKSIGVDIEEIRFVGSRVKGTAKPFSDLDVIVIPKDKGLWNNAQEYTKFMNRLKSDVGDITYQGNKIDVQVHKTFEPEIQATSKEIFDEYGVNALDKSWKPSPSLPSEAQRASMGAGSVIPPVPPNVARQAGNVPPVPPNLPPVQPVPPIPTPPPPGSGYDTLTSMYEAGRKPVKKTTERMLKFMEDMNDETYGLRDIQNRVGKITPVQPGSERDLKTLLTIGGGAPNAGGARFATAIGNIKKIAPDVDLDDIRRVLDTNHFKEVLAEKGSGRIMAGGITDPRQLDDVFPRMIATIGQDKFNKAVKAAEYIRDIYSSERFRLVKSGLLSPEVSTELAQKYPWYNPLQYVEDAEQLASKGRNIKPYDVITSGIRKLSEEGTEKATRNSLDILAETLVKNEVRIVKNDTAKAIIKLALEDPTLAGKVKKIPYGGNVKGNMSFFENGVRQTYEVPEFIYREAIEYGQSLAHPVASLVGSLNGVSRAAFTSASPAFVVSNILNDSLTAFVKHGILPNEIAGRLIKSVLGLSNDKIYQAFNLAGAHQARFYGNDLLKAVEKSGGKVLTSDQSFASKVWKSIPRAGEAGEQAPRVVAFEKELNKTLPNWKRMTAEEIAATPQGRHAAATAVEATINFGRGGHLIKSLNPFVIFLNASMEGMKLPFRALRDSPAVRWRLAGVGAGVMGVTAYNLTYPEYFDIPNNIRWGSVVIMLPSKEKDAYGKNKPNYLTIVPRTREWGAFLGSGTYAMEKMFSDNPTDFGTFSGTMAPMLTPVSNFPAPQVLEELGSQLANYDFYRSQPIVPPEMVNLPNEQQVQPWVSPTIETISNVTGQSPLRAQHLANGLFGGAGQAITSVTDYIAELLVPKQYDQRIVRLADEYSNLDSKVAKNNLIMNLSTKEKDDMFAYINRPQKGIPVVSPVVSRVVGNRGGQLYKTGQEIAQKETGISPQQTKESSSILRKVSDLHLERQKAIDKSFESGTITGTQWKSERASLGQRYQGALDALKIKAPNAAQVQENGDLATQYYKTINTVALTMTDPRDRADVLASGWYAIDLQETEPGSKDWNTYNKMKDNFMSSLSSEDKTLLDQLLKSKMTPTEKVYAHAQEVLKPYWGVTDYVWGKYPPEIKGLSDYIDKVEVTDPEKAKSALQKLPQIMTVRNQIAQMKKLMRDNDPRIAGYIRLFYGR